MREQEGVGLADEYIEWQTMFMETSCQCYFRFLQEAGISNLFPLFLVQTALAPIDSK